MRNSEDLVAELSKILRWSPLDELAKLPKLDDLKKILPPDLVEQLKKGTSEVDVDWQAINDTIRQQLQLDVLKKRLTTMNADVEVGG